MISLYLYLTKDQLTIYEVKRGTIANESDFQGLVLRQENIYYTDMAGYVYYYFNDGDRVSKNSIIYSIDEEENSFSLAEGGEEQFLLDHKDIVKIKKEISNYQRESQNTNFSVVYELKQRLANLAFEISNENMQNSLETMGNSNKSNNFKSISSSESGVVTYYIDNYEDFNEKSITYESFKQDKYNKELLRKAEIYEPDIPVYKIVTSNIWNIMIPLSKEQFESMSEIEEVMVRFIDNNIECNAKLSLLQNKEEYFGKLTLKDYMEEFINQRYVEIELSLYKESGLKIPNSAIEEKDFYVIPNDFFTAGGDTTSKGLILETFDEDNEIAYQFVSTQIFYQDDNFGYVDSNLFEENSWIKSETGERYLLNETAKLSGVYNVNQGYAIFRQIEIIETGDQYSTIKEGTPYGIAVYDQIALIGDTAIEQQIIY